MSRKRVATGVDSRGRPTAAWSEPDPADAPRYRHMEPAHTSPIERRKATEEELAAAAARDEAATRHVLSLGKPRPRPEDRRMIDLDALDEASMRLHETAHEATRARDLATTAWLSAAVAEGKARAAAGAFETALEALQRVIGADVPAVPVPEPLKLVDPPPARPKRAAKGTAGGGQKARDERAQLVLATLDRLGDETAVAKELGMRQNVVRMIVKHARARAAAAVAS